MKNGLIFNGAKLNEQTDFGKFECEKSERVFVCRLLDQWKTETIKIRDLAQAHYNFQHDV